MSPDMRISILGGVIFEWQRQALVKLHNQYDIEYTLIVEHSDRDHPLELTVVENFLKLPTHYDKYGWWPLVEIENKLTTLLIGENNKLSKTHQSSNLDILENARHLSTDTIDDGAWSELPTETVAEVEEDSDVALRFGFGLLRGDILSAPEYGVLSFHPADVRRYRGQGPEQTFMNGDRYGGATLQQLTDDIDGGYVIALDNIDVSNCYTLQEVWNKIQQLQINLLSEGIANLLDPDFEPWIPDNLGEYHSHSDRNSLSFVLRLLLKNQRGRWTKLLQ